MSKIPLHVLPTFVAAAQLQNLRLAAAQLHLTHSAVSQQIAGLEERLGFQVFDRVGRGIVLNAAGQALLRSVEPALERIQEGVHAATVASCGDGQPLRVTMLPSFAQRWFLPRLGLWRERHPGIPLEIEASANIIDLQRDGFHAAIRTGPGPWPGLVVERLYETPTPFIAVAAPAVAHRLREGRPADLAREPLLGDGEVWEKWFAGAGVRTRATPVASFNDVGLMLQATEQGLGLAVVRELLAADALRDGRLARLFDVSVVLEGVQPYSLAYPTALVDWPPLVALRDWVRHEFDRSLALLRTIER